MCTNMKLIAITVFSKTIHENRYLFDAPNQAIPLKLQHSQMFSFIISYYWQSLSISILYDIIRFLLNESSLFLFILFDYHHFIFVIIFHHLISRFFLRFLLVKFYLHQFIFMIIFYFYNFISYWSIRHYHYYTTIRSLQIKWPFSIRFSLQKWPFHLCKNLISYL